MVCVAWAGAQAARLYEPLKLPFLCGLFTIVVNVVAHGSSIGGDLSRAFITWLLSIVIVHSLSVRRDFFFRCVFVLWIIGLCTLPFLQVSAFGAAGESMDARLSVDRSVVEGVFNNANGLGTWFGFCCVCFVVTALESRRDAVRAASSAAAVLSLLVVGVTVSRGALFGTALGITIAMRRVLKRGFVPVLVLIALLGVGYAAGLFDPILEAYVRRGTEDTGRLTVWPLAIARFMESPVLGVGSDEVFTWVPADGYSVAPHNTFIWFALSSGIVGLALFTAWWIQMALKALPLRNQSADAAFRMPLLIFVLVATISGDLAFMLPWAVVALSISTPPNANPYLARRVVTSPAGAHSAALGRSG